MKYKVGDKVRIKADSPRFGWNTSGKMDKWVGKIMTIRLIIEDNYFLMEEDQNENNGLGWSWYVEDLEKVEQRKEDMETKKFTRDDLKDLMLIEVRCGKRYLWINGKPIQIKGFVGYINDDLKNEYNEDYDIVKVGYPNKKADTIEEMLKMDFSEIIWEREPALKDISLEEIKTLLKEKYPDVDVFNLPIKDGETK